MVHRYLAVALLGILGISLGCAMCEDTYDYAYPAYGSVHPRADRFCGRVGSDFGSGGEMGTIETIESIQQGPMIEVPPDGSQQPELAPGGPNDNGMPPEEGPAT